MKNIMHSSQAFILLKFKFQSYNTIENTNVITVVPTKSDSDTILCLQLLSKILTCTLHLSLRESIDHLCMYPILKIGLLHK